MKKSIFFVALAATALTFVSCGSKKEYKPYFPQTGWEYYELKGKVKELHIVKSTSYDGDIENAYDRDTIVVFFNENGQTEKRIYNGGMETYFYTYSGDTCFIERHKNEWLQYGIEDEGNRIDGYQVIVKDKRGNWTSLSVYDTDIVGDTLLNTIRHEYKYNEQGWLTEVLDYSYSRLMCRYVLSDHNENGFYHKQMTYNEDGDCYDITIYEGEDMDHVSKTVSKDKDGNVKSETSYEYDEYGSTTKVININKENQTSYEIEMTYKYDQRGNCIENIQTTRESDYITKEERTIVYY